MSKIDNHIWIEGWIDSDFPHPGFGGTQNIYGGYTAQCEKCGMYIHEYDNLKQSCKNVDLYYGEKTLSR